MTGNIVPGGVTCIKCERCGSLYTTDEPPVFGFSRRYYEPCPVCGHDMNSKFETIPLTKFKMIRWWRRVIRGGET